MYTTNNLMTAIETVLNWDIPDHLLPIAINYQARLHLGFDAEELGLEIYD